nr:hypothetical protein CFP56_50335 [Quercus suber]
MRGRRYVSGLHDVLTSYDSNDWRGGRRIMHRQRHVDFWDQALSFTVLQVHDGDVPSAHDRRRSIVVLATDVR